MPAPDQRVRPPAQPLTEADARHLLATGLLRVSHERGPTRVALTIGCDEKTVRKARDEHSTLRLDLAFNLLLEDVGALDALLAHFGLVAVPMGSQANTEHATAKVAGAVHQLAVAQSPASPGGAAMTRDELFAMEADLQAAHRVTGTLLQMIDDMRKGRRAT